MAFNKTLTMHTMISTINRCKLVGLWKDNDGQRPRWQALFVFGCVIFWNILPSITFITLQPESFLAILKAILELFAAVVFALRLVTHMIYLSTYRRCFVDVQSVLSEFIDNPNKGIQQKIRHLRKSANYLVKFYPTAVLIQGSIYGVFPLVLTTFKYVTNKEATILPSTVFEANFIFFDQKSRFAIWLPVMLTSTAVQYFLMASFTADECLNWNLLHHVSGLFQIIRMEIFQLDECVDPVLYRKKLAFIVNNHDICFRCARDLEKVLSPVMALLYCSCVFQTCYVMFAVSAIDDVILIAVMIFILQYTVFMIFTFSMLGSELTEASSSISDAIYNTKWYERTVAEQRMVLFVQMRSQVLIAISATKFFYITRDTFMTAMKTAFSYFSIMVQLYSEE